MGGRHTRKHGGRGQFGGDRGIVQEKGSVEEMENLHRVERERIHRPYVVYVVNRLPVALERILLLLRLRTGVEVLHGDPSLH